MGGGGGADRAITSVSPLRRTHACSESKTCWCQCTSSFGWTDQQDKNPTPCSLRRQVPGVSGAKNHPTPRRGKRLRGTPTSLPPLLRRKGRAIFSIFLALDALDPDKQVRVQLDVSSWLTGPAFPKLPLQSMRFTEVTALLLPTPFPTEVKPRVKLPGKNSSTVPELQSAIKKPRC